MRTHERHAIRAIRTLLILGAAGALLLFAAGLWRYGGPTGLWRRVQALAPAPRPPSAWAPTPLPTPPGPIVTRTPLAQIPPAPPPSTAAATATRSADAVMPLDLSADAVMPRPTSTFTLTPPAPVAALAPSVALTGLRHEWQTWNNCGPATLASHLSYFDSPLRQEEVRRALRPNPEDKNVNLEEMAAFARDQGLQALVRTHGDAERLRLFLSNGLPVLIETWLEPHPNDGMGHYRLLTGYDDASQVWIVYDSYVSQGLKKGDPYQGIRLPYAEVEALWRVFNHAYLLVYRAEQAPLVTAILAADADEALARQRGLAQAQAAVESQPQDAFVWFNLGSDLTAVGQFAQAAAAYDRARQLGLPWRMFWYQFGPFVAYSEVGRYQEVLALADATLKTTTDVEELHYWRGRGLAALGDAEGARRAFAQALALNPGFTAAAAALTP